MNTLELNRTDGLEFWFDASENPLADGGIGMEPLLDALEANAGEWMPTVIRGKRERKYTRAAFNKACIDEGDYWDDKWVGTMVSLGRRLSPHVRLTVHFDPYPGPNQLRIALTVLPFSFFSEPTTLLERNRRLVALARDLGSRYPVTYSMAHDSADLELFDHWKRTNEHEIRRPVTTKDHLYTVHWLNILGKDMVDELGRERVLSTPAHLVEELPTGAVLLVTRPSVADFASEEARQAQARALVHLRPELDFDTVLHELREHSAALAPVEPRFDPDVGDLWFKALDQFPISQRQRQIAEWNQRPVPPVDEWLPVNAAPRSDVADEKAAIEHYSTLGEGLVVLFHDEVPSLFNTSPESLTDLDLHLWFARIPDRYIREVIESHSIPDIGAYLGKVMVNALGGRWVPRRNLDEVQVVLGDRAWLPFVRARRYMQDMQSVLDYSLTKFYREVERHHRRQNP